MKIVNTGIITSALLVVGVGCSNLPGSNEQQGAVVGGATGAAVGATVTKNRALGAVIGGAVGAAGGYVIGKQVDRKDSDEKTVEQAAQNAQTAPATAEQAKTAVTADVNSDGFVTLDEVVALEQAGIADDQMIEKLRATKQVFDLTDEQSKYLLDRGVSTKVVTEMASLNRNLPNNSPAPSNPVISKPGS
ncbi:MAG TPA: glycine zipper domain-containing protein, partial [Methylomirabilota bacterium]|nr:glycine zipper domain-containing protein [Methylomirabilota bacterium]